jgi:hypothetical protein
MGGGTGPGFSNGFGASQGYLIARPSVLVSAGQKKPAANTGWTNRRAMKYPREGYSFLAILSFDPVLHHSPDMVDFPYIDQMCGFDQLCHMQIN